MIAVGTMQEATGAGPDSKANAETDAQGQVLSGVPPHATDPYAHESEVMPHHQMHDAMNGAMPPQQVYVSSVVPGMPPASITGLENQFQSLGFKQEDSSGHGTDQLTNSGPNSESNNLEETDGEDTDEEPVKLFVGQVRTLMTKGESVGQHESS